VIKMKKRLSIVGYGLLVVGLVFVIVGGVAYSRVQQGYDSLQSFSEAQNVNLSYNEDGQLIDRGTTEGADAIMALLTDDWNYPVNNSDFDANDTLVNTGSEYMYQMATINYHVLHGTQSVTLAEDVEFEGELFEAGVYDVAVDARYWTDFNRSHPLDGAARGQAWTGTVHGLTGELGVGAVTASTLQMGVALAGLFAGVGLIFMLSGGGLVWSVKGKEKVLVPDTVPEALLADGKSKTPVA
jgi:hypothetical protein